MIKRQLLTFFLRWVVSCLCMYVCIKLFAQVSQERAPATGFWLYVLSGLVFALVNAVVRPLATLVALPFLLATLGLFMVVVNVAMVGLAIWIIPGVTIGFWGAVGGAVLISGINLLVNLVAPDVK